MRPLTVTLTLLASLRGGGAAQPLPAPATPQAITVTVPAAAAAAAAHSTSTSAAAAPPTPPPPQPLLPAWRQWIARFGHDVFTYPDWITAQMEACKCSRDVAGLFSCTENVKPLPAAPTELTFCVAKEYLLRRMPTFDMHYLPAAVTVTGKNMLDDNIAFALMANNASKFSSKLPVALRLAYVLPYSSFHEPRNNWRPLFFSKFFSVSSEANSTVAAMQTLNPGIFNNWSGHPPMNDLYDDDLGRMMRTLRGGDDVGVSTGDRSGSGKGNDWSLGWSSSTAPPITGPFDFVVYGHGSCTAWSTMITYRYKDPWCEFLT